MTSRATSPSPSMAKRTRSPGERHLAVPRQTGVRSYNPTRARWPSVCARVGPLGYDLEGHVAEPVDGETHAVARRAALGGAPADRGQVLQSDTGSLAERVCPRRPARV